MDEKLEDLLRMGDTTLILSQRLTEWCGKAPALEEDMALANVALDLLGQARMWLSYAGEVEGRGRTEDDLAYHRDAHQFRNTLLVERPNGSYADTLMRQFLFDTWHHLVLELLTGSPDDQARGIADKALKEVRYHLRRSTDLVVRLGDGSDESHFRMQSAADELWMYTADLFDAHGEDRADVIGIAGKPDALHAAWIAHVTHVFNQATLGVPVPGIWMQSGGRLGRHGEEFGYLIAEMQFMQRAYPGMQW